jgi:hypothetical protein
MRLDAAATRAAGFAGCNRYSAGYLLMADSLRFTAPISTKMACADGMDAESSFLAALSTIATYQATDSTLTLSGPAGPLARFRAPERRAPRRRALTAPLEKLDRPFVPLRPGPGAERAKIAPLSGLWILPLRIEPVLPARQFPNHANHLLLTSPAPAISRVGPAPFGW